MSEPLWSEFIDRACALTDYSDEEMTNAVIVEYLKQGDLRPLQEMLEGGFKPSEEVLLLLGEMMNPAGKTPYRIEKPTKRGKGPKHKPDLFMRNLKLAEQVMIVLRFFERRKKAARMTPTQDEAFRLVAGANGVSWETVRDAYRQVLRRAKNN